MKVRFTYLQFPADRIDEAKRVYVSEIAPVIRATRGNINALFLEPSGEGGRYVSCTMWQSEEDLRAFETGDDYKKVMGRIRSIATDAEQQYFNVL